MPHIGSVTKLAKLAELHNPFDKKQSQLALDAMERTVIQTKIEDEIEPRSRSRSRVMSKDRSQSQIDPNQSRAMSMSISMVNSKQDKIMA